MLPPSLVGFSSVSWARLGLYKSSTCCIDSLEGVCEEGMRAEGQMVEGSRVVEWLCPMMSSSSLSLLSESSLPLFFFLFLLYLSSSSSSSGPTLHLHRTHVKLQTDYGAPSPPSITSIFIKGPCRNTEWFLNYSSHSFRVPNVVHFELRQHYWKQQ